MDELYKDVFNKLFASQGGYFNLTDLEDAVELKVMYEEFLDRCTKLVDKHLLRYVDPPKFHLAFLRSTELSAIVGKSGEDYYIGLNFGSILVMSNLFGRVLCSPNILPYIGEISLEENQKIKNPYIFGLEALLDNSHNYPDQRSYPIGIERQDWASTLVFYCIQFITLHELGHIMRGHLSYKLSKNEIPIQILAPGLLQGLVSQGMELDADYYATFHGTREVISLLKSETMKHKGRQIVKVEAEEMLKLWIFAIHSMNSLYDLVPIQATTLENKSHPPFGMRTFSILRIIMNALDGRGEFGGDEQISAYAHEFVMHCAATSMHAFDEICDDDGIKFLQSKNAMTSASLCYAHSKNVWSAYNIIWPEIRKHKLLFVDS